MAVYSILFIVLASILLCEKYVLAQQEQEFVHPLTDMPEPSEDVETSYFFPDYKDQKFPLGSTVTVLCHFSNDGLTPLNITAIMGSLNHPGNFLYHIQNYTYKPFGVVVKGGEEITLQYQFQPHPDLEVAEYAMAHTVFYHSESEIFSSTFFNQTVELLPEVPKFDLLGIIQLSFSFASAVAVAVVVYLACSPDKASLLFGKSKSSSNSRVAPEDDDWDADFIVKKEAGGKPKKAAKK